MLSRLGTVFSMRRSVSTLLPRMPHTRFGLWCWQVAHLPTLPMYSIWQRSIIPWDNFKPIWPDILFGAMMGVLWMGSMAIYGTATTFLGSLGASLGRSIFQISIILTANI